MRASNKMLLTVYYFAVLGALLSSQYGSGILSPTF